MNPYKIDCENSIKGHTYSEVQILKKVVNLASLLMYFSNYITFFLTLIFSSNTFWSAFAVDWLLRSDTSHHQRLLYCLHWVWALPQNARISLPDHICQRSPVNALLRLKPRFLTSVWGNFDFDLILLSLQISNLHHLSIHFGFAIFTTFQPSFTWNDAKWDS